MLASVVIQVAALQEGAMPDSNGMAINAAWYHGWLKADADTAVRVHDGHYQIKPFTVSPLMELSPASDGVCHYRRGHLDWFRVTTLQASLTRNLHVWLDALHHAGAIEIDHAPWRIERIHTSSQEHPLAGQISYDALIQLVDLNPLPHRWRLSFVTPMTLRGDHAFFPFPQPESLVRSWLSRWNAFSPHPLPDDLLLAARQHLTIETYALKTVAIRLHRATFPGCVGEITLKLRRAASREEQRAIALLAEYAFFCGSGYKTPQGLGQTRLLELD